MHSLGLPAVLLIGYLAGCFQTAFILGKLNRHIDIRQYGSGNSGTTNALRVMGLKLGVLTFIGDFLKAFFVVIVIWTRTEDSLLAAVAALGVILGHDFPIFLNFRGGKGIASTIGVAFALDYRAGIISIFIMVIVILLTKYVSVASITLCFFIGIYFFAWKDYELSAGLILQGIALLGIFQHRENIRRIYAGKEHRLSFGKKN